MSRSLYSTNFFNDFSCIGAACEATCCHYSWSIYVDKDAYYSLQQQHALISQNVPFESYVTKQQAACSELGYGLIAKDSDDKCRYYSADNLCEIHKKLGEPSLPRTCATYPRIKVQLSETEDEIITLLGCPEAARQCLLSEGEFALSQVSGPERFSDIPTVSHYEQSQDNLYTLAGLNPGFRSLFERLLSSRQLPLECRLFVLLIFCDKADATCSPEQLAQTLIGLEGFAELLTNLSTQQQLLDQYDSMAANGLELMALLRDLFVVKSLDERKVSLFSKLLEKSLANCHQHFGKSTEQNLTHQELFTFYSARQTAVSQVYKSRIDALLSNFVLYFLHTEPAAKYQGYIGQAKKLLMLLSLVKFFFYTHPALNSVNDQDLSADDQAALIEKVMVEVVYSCSRDLVSKRGFAQFFYQHLSDNNIHDFSSLIKLLKF